MGPNLICDKSTLQALNPGELTALRRYYSLNIPPILLVEILGDLKKHADSSTSRNDVKILANKLMPACSTVTTNFRHLIQGELAGYPIRMEGIPVLARGKNVIAPDGKKGVIFETSPEETALLRWQDGKFNEAEEMLAEMWRLSTTSIDLELMQRHLKGAYSGSLNLQTLAATGKFVDELMLSASPKMLLEWFLHDIGMFGEKAVTTIEKFNFASPGALQKSAPYTAFCARAALVFHFALAFGLVTTRATNRIDLEYFYYTPFCQIFSSGDTFHRKIAPLVMRDQVFVDRDIFKTDLKQLAEWWKKLTPDELEKELDIGGPPENEASVTHQLWEKTMKAGYRNRKRSEQKISKEDAAKIYERLQRRIKEGVPTNQNFNESMDDCDFMAVQHTVRLDGPCICSSGKLFKDCCGSKIIGSKQ
jgi:hypothetical protein